MLRNSCWEQCKEASSVEAREFSYQGHLRPMAYKMSAPNPPLPPNLWCYLCRNSIQRLDTY